MSASFVLGLRTGELLGLKIEDVELDRDDPLLHVRVRPNDPDDPRKLPADQKTRGRSLPLSDELATAFRELLVDRRRLPPAKRHKYLFVNERGAPLGLRGARLQYEILRKAVPQLENLINHRCRHDWNDRWREMAKGQNWNLEEALRYQIFAMGWSIGSKMPGLYGKREQRRQTNERLLEIQRDAYGIAGGTKGRNGRGR